MGGNYWAFHVSGGQVRVQTLGDFVPLGLHFCKTLKGLKMTNKTYNGWTNYETWRVKLEIFDGVNLKDISSRFHVDEAYNLGHDLKEYAVEILESEGAKGLTFDYAMAFLDTVNWYEIAEHLISDYLEENAEDGEEVEE